MDRYSLPRFRRPQGAALARAALAAILLAGCRVFPQWETVSFRVPEAPASWLECGLKPSWSLRAEWPGGSQETLAPTGVASFRLPRGESSAVLAFPMVDGRRLKPAGVVLPDESAADGIADLTWEGGYEAECARALLRAGVDPGCFDLERFSSEAFARMADPWVTDPGIFSDEFREGHFRVYWLEEPAAYSARAEGLPGPAASESPFGQSLEPDGEGVAAAELTEGVHRWYADWGRVSAQVCGDGQTTWIVVR